MAYAVVISLKQTLELLLDSGRSRIKISSSELQPIYEDLCYLKSFFDKMNSLEDSNSVEELEKDIKDVLQNTRDLIESHLSDLLHSAGDASGFSRQLVEVKLKLCPLINMLKAKENELTGIQQLPTDVAVDVPVYFPSRIKHEIVGLEDEVAMLQQRLLDPDSRLQVVYIVGMAGSGKTTLAYDLCDRYRKFSLRLFATIGVEYSKVEEVPVYILRRLMGNRVNDEMPIDKLGNLFMAYLSHQNYLVVIDDVCDMQVWDHLRPYFPDERNGSRVVFTTSTANVDRVSNYQYSILHKRLLNDQESWVLFRKMAFSDVEMDKCPSGLEEIGKTIARNMGGLPSALVEIGGVLSKLPKTVECWSKFAQNMHSHIQKTAILKEDMNVQLPQHLKACFLYLGVFQPEYHIPTSQLIKLWVAEGFIEPEADQSLEQIAEEYLEDLVSRGLVIVHDRSYTGGIKTCGVIHKLVRDVCVTEARQQKLFHIVNNGTSTKNQRRLSIQSDVAVGVMVVSRVRSLVYMCPQHQDPLPVFERVRWLRVLHALPIRFSKFPDEVLKLVRLRYLAIKFDGELPSSISTLWDLQVLIIVSSRGISRSSVFLPSEIWELQKLRHLRCMGFDLPVPPADLYLMNLLTLSGVSFRTCGDGVLARIPNLIKLGIRFNPADHAVEMSCFYAVFSHLHHLKSFKCAVMNQSKAAFSLIGFPSGITKLNLGGTGFVWNEHSTIISQLSNLQVLKLRWRAFCGPKWELRDGDVYRCLKFLVLEDLDLKELKAEPHHFPVLKQLLIRRCYKLQEIPFAMGEISTLEVIELDGCSISLVESVKRIQAEQQQYGSVNLQLQIHSPSDGDCGHLSRHSQRRTRNVRRGRVGRQRNT